MDTRPFTQPGPLRAGHPSTHRGSKKGTRFRMKSIRTSYYPRRDKVVAALEVVKRLREKWPGDAFMTALADQLEKWARRMADGYGGLDTRGATEDVRIADDNRDTASQALRHHLQAILCSVAHRESWEAASRLFRVLAADGLGWIHDAYAAETLKLRDILGQYAGMGADIEQCQARVFVDQLAAAQTFFEQKLAERGAAQAEKPEVLAKIHPDFERTLRATLLVLEGRPADADRAYVLEPFTSLRRKYGPGATDPAPAPQA